MMGIETRGDFDSDFQDCGKIDQDTLNNICKIGKKEKTCRYVMLCSFGYICAKSSPIATVLDKSVNENKMVAKGDNCEGLRNYEKNEKEDSKENN